MSFSTDSSCDSFVKPNLRSGRIPVFGNKTRGGIPFVRDTFCKTAFNQPGEDTYALNSRTTRKEKVIPMKMCFSTWRDAGTVDENGNLPEHSGEMKIIYSRMSTRQRKQIKRIRNAMKGIYLKKKQSRDMSERISDGLRYAD